jgi:hypothetical protein
MRSGRIPYCECLDGAGTRSDLTDAAFDAKQAAAYKRIYPVVI